MKKLVYRLVIFCVLLGGCSGNEGRSEHEQHGQREEEKIFTCPMHPEITRNKPGACPICGMDLVEKRTKGERNQDTALTFLLKPADAYVQSDIKTVQLVEKELSVVFTAAGNIWYDTRLINTVSARVSGRIEKLYARYRFQPIKKGEKLMDIYSEDIVTEQENYIFLLTNDNDNETMINAAGNKLMLLGLNKEQIEELKRSKKIIEFITIYSPYTGHLHGVQPTEQNGGMNSDETGEGEMSFREGMYVEKGQIVFSIYDTKKVWALLGIYPQWQDVLKKDQLVKLVIDGIRDSITAKIDFIEPVMRQGQKTITARVYLNNPDGIARIGANVMAVIRGARTRGSFVPTEAVLSLGLNEVVFVKKDELFEVTPVKLGVRTDKWVEIIAGLEKSGRVAGNAQLLMDSESFIRVRSGKKEPMESGSKLHHKNLP